MHFIHIIPFRPIYARVRRRVARFADIYISPPALHTSSCINHYKLRVCARYPHTTDKMSNMLVGVPCIERVLHPLAPHSRDNSYPVLKRCIVFVHMRAHVPMYMTQITADDTICAACTSACSIASCIMHSGRAFNISRKVAMVVNIVAVCLALFDASSHRTRCARIIACIGCPACSVLDGQTHK